MFKIRFTSNTYEIQSKLPSGFVNMNILPEIGHQVRFSSFVCKIVSITHVLDGYSDPDRHYVLIYLTKTHNEY